MLGNFSYHNPTKLYFGEESLAFLKDEMKKYGENILLVYGGGSIKKSGLYDEIIAILKECGKSVAEVSGIMPNPTVDKLREGVKIARENNSDFILAVGGGITAVLQIYYALRSEKVCEICNRGLGHFSRW